MVIGGQVYDILTVNAGTKEIQISPPYAGSTASSVSYVIHRDFTTNTRLALINPGDLEAAAIFSRNMGILDQLFATGGGSASLGEVAVSVTAHGFQVGNFLSLVGGVWVLSTSATIAYATSIGVVKEVTNANAFKIVTQGRISGITGITLTPGNTYYLRSSTVAGGAGNVNITDNLTYTLIKTPVLIADSSSSGFILSLSRSQSGVFAQDVAGIVPGPTAAQVLAGKFLRADGGWEAQTLANDSILLQHLAGAGAINWTNFAAKQTGLSVFSHILDLQTRLAVSEARGTVLRSFVAKVAHTLNGSGAGSWTVPSGVTSIEIDATSTIVESSYAPVYTVNSSTAVIPNRRGRTYKIVVAVTPEDTLSWTLRAVSSIPGNTSGGPLPTVTDLEVKLNGTTIISLNPGDSPFSETLFVLSAVASVVEERPASYFGAINICGFNIPDKGDTRSYYVLLTDGNKVGFTGSAGINSNVASSAPISFAFYFNGKLSSSTTYAVTLAPFLVVRY